MPRLRFASPLEWLFLGICLWLVWRYAWLLDDAFIYFRYVDNWVLLGRGLVYNTGEYVEGFTSPLWTLMLAPLRCLRLDYWTLVRASSLVFAAVFWGSLVAVHRALSGPGPVVNFPLALCSVHYGVLAYFSSGLETPLVQLSAAVYAALALKPESRSLAGLAGLAPMVRHELVLALLVYAAMLFWSTRRLPIWLLGSASVSLTGWLLFRVYYYADLLPNTFYLKDATDFTQGTLYLLNSLNSHHLLFVLPVLALAYLFLRSDLPDGERQQQVKNPLRTPCVPRARGMMLAASFAVGLYVWRSGGDMLYYRLLAFPMVLAVLATGGITEAVLRRLRLPSTQLFYAGVASGLALFFAVGYPAQLRIHPLLMNADTSAPMRKVDNISESAWHRHHPELRYSAVRKLQDADLLTRYEQASERQLNQTNVAIGGFCAALFFAFDSFVIHSWGLTQPILARADVPTDRPGHKYGLRPLAQDLAAVYRAEPRGRGMFQRAVADGKAPSFVRENLTRIRVLERKMYNQHAFGENLKLALARPGPIVVPKTPGH